MRPSLPTTRPILSSSWVKRSFVSITALNVSAILPCTPVRSSWNAEQTVSKVEGPGVNYISIAAGSPRPPDLLSPLVLSGRMPADDRVDEVLVGEDMARETGLQVGAVVPLKMLTTQEFEQFDTGFGEPDGPSLTVRVVGIGRFPGWGNGLGYVLGTPAFAAGAFSTTSLTSTPALPGMPSFAAASSGKVRICTPR